MKFSHILLLLTTTRAISSALTASNAQPNPSTLLAPAPNNLTFNATRPNPLQRPKTYHVPLTPLTLIFILYTAPPTLAPATTYQTLLTALHSIYDSTLLNHGDGLIYTDTLSWSHGGAAVTIENHGEDRTGRLTWGMLAHTMYGVGAFLQGEGCWSGEWMVMVEGAGNIGSGFVGGRVDVAEMEGR